MANASAADGEATGSAEANATRLKAAEDEAKQLAGAQGKALPALAKAGTPVLGWTPGP